MKSFLSLGMGKPAPVLESPKPASGILPHGEEDALANLWVDIIKSETACCKLISEVRNYRDSIKEVQEAEEKLLKDLGASGLGAVSLQLQQANDEYLSVVMEMKTKSEETSAGVQEVLGDPIKQYHALFEPLDALRKRRDAQLMVVQKCQDKLDKLKLKGKRNTDVIVERESAMAVLRELNGKLLKEAKHFHDLRQPYLQPCILAYVQNQVDYYGTANAQFNSQVQISRGVHQIKDNEYEAVMGEQLNKIKSLNIVAA